MRDNPAQRLHDLLAPLRSQPGNNPVRSTWAAVTGIPDSNTTEIFQSVSNALALPAQAELGLKNLFRDNRSDLEMFLGWKFAVNQALAQLTNLEQPTTSVVAHYSDATLVSLQHASYQLRAGGQAAPTDQVAALHTSLDYLGKQIRESTEIADDLKLFMLDLLHELRRALLHLRTLGVDGIQHAVDQSVGALVRRWASPENNAAPLTLWKRLLNVVQQAGQIVNVANSTYQLSDHAYGAIRAIGK